MEIVFSILSFLILLVLAVIIFPVFSDTAASASRRTINSIQPLINLLFGPQPYAAFVSVILSCIYALIVLILIYFYFEKTQCQEILFFTFFVLSFCFESFRFAVPLNAGLELPRIYVIIAGRIMLFGRTFGVLSLFAASIYAAGFEMQKQSHLILIIVTVSLIIASGMPIDALTWDSSLNLVSGYSTMTLLTESGIFVISIISFFAAVFSRGSKQFIRIGLGSILLFFGRNLLLNSDTWIILPIAAGLMGVGTWFVSSRLHQIYLWL